MFGRLLWKWFRQRYALKRCGFACSERTGGSIYRGGSGKTWRKGNIFIILQRQLEIEYHFHSNNAMCLTNFKQLGGRVPGLTQDNRQTNIRTEDPSRSENNPIMEKPLHLRYCDTFANGLWTKTERAETAKQKWAYKLGYINVEIQTDIDDIQTNVLPINTWYMHYGTHMCLNFGYGETQSLQKMDCTL